VAIHGPSRQLGGTFRYRDADDPAWWSSLLKYVDSVFFMVSAIAAFALTTTVPPTPTEPTASRST